MIDFNRLMDTVQTQVSTLMRKPTTETARAPQAQLGAQLNGPKQDEDQELLNRLDLAVQREGGINN